MSNPQEHSIGTSLLEHITQMLDAEDNETIDGVLLKDIVEAVEPDLAGEPYCVPHRFADWQVRCPDTVRYERWTTPDRWAIVMPELHDFEIVSEDTLKRMRGRFLLMNGWYYRNFWTLGHQMRCEVMHHFIRHSFQQVPYPDSPLAKMLGVVDPDSGEGVEAINE